MGWYKLQQASSTAFRSIQHHRDSDPPFFHEFLLLQLNDGALCRIERTGQGSRIDAIRNIGCTAHDYIQYFSASDYKAFTVDKPSELIAQVDLPHDFDIMDVLAICYAIYKRPRTRAYTLQRFNCYFLCGTILLVLTRRLVRWEAMVTFDIWNEALYQSLDRLAHISRDPTKRYLLLHVCRLLEPDTPEPAGFIFKALRDRLGTLPDAYNSLKQALINNLWRNAWNGRMNQAIVDHVNNAVAVALEGDGDCAKVLRSATHDSKKVLQAKIESYATVNNILNKKAVDALSDGTKALAKATGEHYRMEKMERPHSVIQEVWIFTATHVCGALFPIQLALSGDMEEWGFKDIFLGSLRGIITAQTVGVIQSRRLLGMREQQDGTIVVGGTQGIDTTISAPASVAQVNYDMAARTLDETLTELSERGILTPPNITIALHGILCKNMWDAWLNRSVCDLLRATLPDMLLEEEGILVKIPNEDGSFTEMRSVVQFQNHMHQRIEAHASRVEAYRLAAAPLVNQDIHDAITDVWMSIPPGFSDPVPVNT